MEIGGIVTLHCLQVWGKRPTRKISKFSDGKIFGIFQITQWLYGNVLWKPAVFPSCMHKTKYAHALKKYLHPLHSCHMLHSWLWSVPVCACVGLKQGSWKHAGARMMMMPAACRVGAQCSAGERRKNILVMIHLAVSAEATLWITTTTWPIRRGCF